MSHAPPTADPAARSDSAFWASYHATAAARDHRAWAASGREFARRYGLAGADGQVPVGEYHARLGPTVYHLWETAQTLYRGLPDPPVRAAPPSAGEGLRYDGGCVNAGPNVVWVDGPGFDAEVLAVAGRVVVVLWAGWSGPDHQLLTWLRGRAADWPGVKFAVLSIEDAPDVAAHFRSSCMPTTLAFEGGELVGRLDGLPGYDREGWARAFEPLTGRAAAGESSAAGQVPRE